MKKIIIAALTALPLAIASVPAMAVTDVPCQNPPTQPAANASYWDGVIQVYNQSAQCSQQYFSAHETAHSIYRPYLVGIGEPPSAFTHVLENHIMMVTNQSSTAQFSGTGNYKICGINENVQMGNPPVANYNITQSPANLTSSDDFVTFEGYLNNYAGETGCKLYIHAIYVRREPPVAD